jgi:hypothetical protein
MNGNVMIFFYVDDFLVIIGLRDGTEDIRPLKNQLNIKYGIKDLEPTNLPLS